MKWRNDDGTRNSTYRSWESMKHRCLNPKSNRYMNYGGRGIVICERWMNFYNFVQDMGPRPAGMFLERRDNDGDYEPDNCEWATHKEQANNRRNNHFIEFNGVSKTIAEWSESMKVSYPALLARLKAGWCAEKALTKPFRKLTRKVNQNGND